MLSFNQVSKSYRQGERVLPILKEVDFELNKGEKVAVLGKSGSGKTTFLSLAAGFDRADSGRIVLGNLPLESMSEQELTNTRKQLLGVIFQNYQLIPHLSALENLRLPLDLHQDPDAEEKARELLEQLEIGERADHFPYQLSGGESQRVAIGRALVHGPELVLADEPTGNLDERTGTVVVDLLWRLLNEKNQSFILVTHDRQLAARCDRIMELSGGAFT